MIKLSLCNLHPVYGLTIILTVAAEELEAVEHTLEANWQSSDNTIGIKESKHIPFSLVHEKDFLNCIKPTPLQCFSNFSLQSG